jgi:amphi-Trp domain-containing protein
MSDKKEVGYKSVTSWDDVVSYLEEILAGMKSGTVTIDTGRDRVELKAGPDVKLEIEATTKKDKNKLVVDLSWRTPPEGLKIQGH